MRRAVFKEVLCYDKETDGSSARRADGSIAAAHAGDGGDAQVITDLSGISAGGSYVVDKSVKDIVLSAPLTLDKT